MTSSMIDLYKYQVTLTPAQDGHVASVSRQSVCLKFSCDLGTAFVFIVTFNKSVIITYNNIGQTAAH